VQPAQHDVVRDQQDDLRDHQDAEDAEQDELAPTEPGDAEREPGKQRRDEHESDRDAGDEHGVDEEPHPGRLAPGTRVVVHRAAREEVGRELVHAVRRAQRRHDHPVEREGEEDPDEKGEQP